MDLSIVLPDVLVKDPSIAWIWATHGTLAVLGFWLCRMSRWWLVVFLPLPAIAVLFGDRDLWDRIVDSTILQEPSSLYIHWHVAIAVLLVAPLLGSAVGARSRWRTVPYERNE